MNKKQILKDVESIYQRALQDGKWNIALRAKGMQAKIMGLSLEGNEIEIRAKDNGLTGGENLKPSFDNGIDIEKNADFIRHWRIGNMLEKHKFSGHSVMARNRGRT